ncbi:MAG: phosphoenolpyruvate--protein phosphotransferase, partial [candidate division WOR-3 bacterium]
RVLRGIPVSSGIVLGSIYIYDRGRPGVPERTVPESDVAHEIQRFRAAVEGTREELALLKAKIQQQAGPTFAEFIDVLLALLDEPELVKGTVALIQERRLNAEACFQEVIRRLSAPLARSPVTFVQERTADLADVANRVLHRLLGQTVPSLYDIPAGAVIAARELPPSEATLLDPRKVAGVAVEVGGKTSHTAIMTKAREIPLLAGVKNLLARVSPGDRAILDGYRGILVLNPTPKHLELYKQEQARLERRRSFLLRHLTDEPVTLDGSHLDIMANTEFAPECVRARECGARGIGLFRSEYLLIARRRPPTEEEQYQVFAEIARRTKPYPVIIRTFDLGGDKVLAGYTEANPFLGWRAIRFCFDNREFFKNQLRAILRASAEGNVKIMFPMIATVEELRRAKLLVSETKAELRRAGIAFDDQIPLGIMVEVPSAALLSRSLARECNFFSIGSNDLTQYTLAVDRGNERVARLYDHFHPAVLRLIRQTIEAAHEQAITVARCGEFASDPLGIVVLIGLGIDELSMVPALIPQAVSVVRACDRAKARLIVEQAINRDTSLEVTRALRRGIDERLPLLAKLLFRNAEPERIAKGELQN